MAEHENPEPELDYTIFSVIIMTLTLLLLVELIRSKLDNQDHHHFYSHVFDNLWHELATIGLVEFGIFVLHEYLPDFNENFELVFAKVHFLIFYTALINVLLTIIVERLTFHRSIKMWFKAEESDLNQYVMIRKGYLDTKKKMETLSPGFLRVFSKVPHMQASEDTTKAGYVHWSFATAVKLAWYNIRHPVIVPQFERLSKQRLFHELRSHFITSNSLPKVFPMTEYLLRCQNDVFHELSHISSITWISFIVLVEILYFLFGAIIYIQETAVSTGKCCNVMLLFVCIISIITSCVINNKMTIIYGHLTHNPAIIGATESWSSRERRDGFKNVQKGLFWLNRPELVIHIFQLIQFVYAVLFSSLIIFQSYIKYLPLFKTHHLFMIIFISYAIFARMTSLVLPKYTECTSLGQLVRESFMYERLAKLHLKQAKKQQQITATVASEEDEDIPFRVAKVNQDPRLSSISKCLINNDGQADEDLEDKMHFSCASAMDYAKTWLKGYFLSPMYRFHSFFFGTLFAFFLIGMRVEVSLLTSKILKDTDSSAYHLRPGDLFWVLFTLYILFLLDALTSSILLNKSTRIFASLFDAVITSACLCFLIVSEILRAEGSVSSRIESIRMIFDLLMGLILLRECRFVFAKLIGKTFQQDSNKRKIIKHKVKDSMGSEVVAHNKENIHAHEAMIILWKRTVENHYSVAKAHGEFSSQILHLMLGLDIDNVVENLPPETEGKVSDIPSEVEIRDFSTGDAVIGVLYPQTHLIAQMHRGELKLEAYSDWHVVDIVITRHELICLDCFDDNGIDIALLDLEEDSRNEHDLKGDELRSFQLRKETRAKLLASKGGQGLFLGDIVAGRSVVSHLELDDVTNAKVERHIFNDQTGNGSASAHVKRQTHSHIRSEYWQSASLESLNNLDSKITADLDHRFDNQEYDQLVLTSRQRLINLRFICDLELAESASNGHIAEASGKTIALDWCSKIVRHGEKLKEEPAGLRRSVTSVMRKPLWERSRSSIRFLNTFSGGSSFNMKGSKSNLFGSDSFADENTSLLSSVSEA